MAGLLPVELANTVRQGLCNITDVAGFTAQLGASFYGSLGLRGASQTSEQAAGLWSAASNLACNRQPQDLSNELDPGFSGGQCSGVSYGVVWQLIRNGSPVLDTNFDPCNFSTNTFPGPIRGIRLTPDAVEGLFSATLEYGSPVQSRPLGNNVEDAFIVTVDRCDGQPDDCGSPPPAIPEFNPGDFTIQPDVTYTDDSGTDVTIPVTIEYSPVVTDDGGNFSVPITVQFQDGSSVFGDFNLTTGDISFGGGNSAGDGVNPDPVELPEGEDPDDLVDVIGVRVVSAIGPATIARTNNLISPSGESIYIPRLGSITFKYAEDVIAQGTSQTFDIMSQDSVIIAPRPIISAQAFPQVGTTFSIRYLVVPKPSSCSC